MIYCADCNLPLPPTDGEPGYPSHGCAPQHRNNAAAARRRLRATPARLRCNECGHRFAGRFELAECPRCGGCDSEVA